MDVPASDAGTDARPETGGPPDGGPDAPVDAPPDGGIDGGDEDGGTDGGGPTCPTTDLFMAEGVSVASGETATSTETFAADCADGAPSPARTFHWAAPRTGNFLFHTAGSDFDTAVVLLETTCTGIQVDCSDDVETDITSRAAASLGAGDEVVIVVTGFSSEDSGNFELSIEEGPSEETGLCGNGADDDRDLASDCEDPDCAAVCMETICDDMIDDDGDGRADCFDSDCASAPACTEICDDSVDNDGNGAIDCLDPDCALDAVCTEDCGNGVDDDGDGSADCLDAFCADDPRCAELDCTNSIDDDGDGFVDCIDGDCTGDPACDPGFDSCIGILCIPEASCQVCSDGRARCVLIGSSC